MGGLATVTYEEEVDKKSHRYEIDLGDNTKIVMKSFKDLVSVAMDRSSKGIFKGSVGMLGGSNGDMFARDGVTILASDPDSFGLEWQVREDEPKLFQNIERFPQYPQTCVMPSKSASAERRRLGEMSLVSEESAAEACKKEGRIHDLDECIYDVLATGDLEIAQAGSF